ncbi:MAG: DNA-processing protein DprA [Clostridia bacterium]|nr:DNA-processing protein DprA [Clostridia bacterium]
MNDIIYWVWLALKNGAGHSDAVKLLKHFPGGAREIYEAPYERIAAVKECSEGFIRRLTDHDLSQAERILEFCFMNGIRVVSCASAHYPRRLQDIYNKPIVLYVRGMIEDINDRFCVSIVGTRKMSNYGKHITFTLARQLIAYGALIISGAAYGIDSAANSTAVFLEEPTVAVLGSGVNVPYPAQNKELIDWIGAHGMVISEFEPNTPPYGRNFPIRNRIISGLADAVIVVEGDAKSGALITARHAADQGRVVYAVPGNVGATNSVGPLRMIRDGARVATCAEDVVEDFADRFKLEKLDRITKSDKYLRYEYNHHIPTQSDNAPLSTKEQDKMGGLHVPPIRRSQNAPVFPDIPTPTDYSSAVGIRTGEKRISYPSPDAYDTADDVPYKQVKQAPAPHSGTSGGYAESRLTKNGGTQSAKASSELLTDDIILSERDWILSKLSETQIRVLDAFPSDKAVTPDKLAEGGIDIADILSSLTVLELYAAIEALPGGLYRRKI